MTRLRTAQFYHGNITTAAWNLVATVPTGHRWIIRSINCSNQSASTAGVTIRVAGANYILSQTLGVVGTSSADLNRQGWIVLDEGNTIEIFGTASRTISVVIGGTDLLI